MEITQQVDAVLAELHRRLKHHPKPIRVLENELGVAEGFFRKQRHSRSVDLGFLFKAFRHMGIDPYELFSTVFGGSIVDRLPIRADVLPGEDETLKFLAEQRREQP